MTCYYPLDAWQKAPGTKPVFKFKTGYSYLQLPCGQCSGCRLARSRAWAVRCVLESQLHDFNCFITLTYADNPVSLRKSDFQKFMKRLRKCIAPTQIKFFMCGEYGENFERPHYHACIFGFDFPDKYLWSVRDGVKLYRSPMLEQLWTAGFSSVGDVTFESAAYVARYVLKKINGDAAAEHYEHVDDFGEVHDRLPEYCDMSRGGRTGRGIAYDWYRQFKSDCEKDYLVMRGVKMRPPRYFDQLLHSEDPACYESIKNSRKAHALQNADNHPARLSVKRQIKERSLKRLKRGFNYEI